MFRLVKVLNGNTQHETLRMHADTTLDAKRGCALTSTNGKLTSPSSTSYPDFVALTGTDDAHGKLDVMMVTEDMVFLIELTGSTVPYVGMRVGLSNKFSKMDAVTYNSNGKGTVIDVGEAGLVYLKFNK